MTEDKADVVVVGAGPNGLMVALELALAGVRPVVIEALPGPSTEPKANGLVGQVIRTMDMRGLYADLGGAAEVPTPISGWTFSGLPVPLTEVSDNQMYALLVPQPRIVQVLEQRVRALGVPIRWGHQVTEVDTADHRVTLEITSPDGEYRLASDYLVAADGGRSLVRKALRVPFPGHTSDMVARLAHVSVPDTIRGPDGSLEVPGFGRIGFGHNRFDRGGVVFAPFEPDRSMIGTIEFGASGIPDEAPMTLAELRESLQRILDADVPIQPPPGAGPHALRRIDGQNTRQAERYRDGRVFLVGDAAHVHSAMGGPGLNLGLQDAVNLGWKLAGQINGWAPTDLLDTYHAERHPVGQRVMMHSMAQTALMTPGPEVAALRALFGEILRLPEAAAHIAWVLAGSDVRYDTGCAHPFAGRMVQDLRLADGRRIADLMHTGRAQLLDFAEGALAEVAAPWRDRVDIVVDRADIAQAGTLIRPDGYVAWASEDAAGDRAGLTDALTKWFGTP